MFCGQIKSNSFSLLMATNSDEYSSFAPYPEILFSGLCSKRYQGT